MLDAARRVPDGCDLWLVPVEDLFAPLEVSPACLRSMPRRAAQGDPRRDPRDSRAPRPVEGVVLVKAAAAAPVGAGAGGPTTSSPAARSASRGAPGRCTTGSRVARPAPRRGRPRSRVTARDGAIMQATPAQNLVALERARPDSPSGLPAHITSTTTAGRSSTRSIRARRATWTSRASRPRARASASAASRRPSSTRRRRPLELRPAAGSRRTQARCSPAPPIASDGRRCLLIGPRRRLRAGKRAHRFCVDDAKLRARALHRPRHPPPERRRRARGLRRPRRRSAGSPSSARSARARSGSRRAAQRRVLHRHPRHPRRAAASFKLHAARRGAPVRYTGLQTVRLNPSP